MTWIAAPLAVAILLSVEVKAQSGETAGTPGGQQAADQQPRAMALSSGSPSIDTDYELDEVLVTAEQQQRLGNRDHIVIWLRRLAGRFRNEGTLKRGSTTVPGRCMAPPFA